MLTTMNEGYGFFGTIEGAANREVACRAWARAMDLVREATGCRSDAIRDFLDSAHGRVFADIVADRLPAGVDTAVATTVREWTEKRVSVRYARRFGVPFGASQLKSTVLVCAMEHARS